MQAVASTCNLCKIIWPINAVLRPVVLVDALLANWTTVISTFAWTNYMLVYIFINLLCAYRYGHILAWLIGHTFSAKEYYFSLITNQQTVFFSLTFQLCLEYSWDIWLCVINQLSSSSSILLRFASNDGWIYSSYCLSPLPSPCELSSYSQFFYNLPL